jgi:glycosyltransferase involved in cell wall biosynthesis
MSISIITATYNSVNSLPNLVNSLREQTDKSFEWVVADGGSNDGTLDYLKSIKDLDLKIINGPDFGIYDALNKAIEKSNGDYYVVIGSDDVFYPDAIENFKIFIDDSVDVITAHVRCLNKIHMPSKKKLSIFSDAWDYVSCHSVGCVFRKSLHSNFGYYSKRFPIAADQYFIKKIVAGGARIVQSDFIAGEFGSTGVSSTDLLGHITETFRIQYETESNKKVQFFLFILRLLKNKLIGSF